MQVNSFPPVCGSGARVLILGSMPGIRSLQAGQYYAHPRNAFWPIMESLFSIPASADYSERLAGLKQAGIALWDTLGQCYREGSLDASIEATSERPNDFLWLFDNHPGIGHIFFNGAKAESSFRKHVLARLEARYPNLVYTRLPSTSPAHASLSFDQKRQHWEAVRVALQSSASGSKSSP